MALFCTECTYQFFYDPFKVGVAISSLLIALGIVLFLRYKSGLAVRSKMSLMYAHIFFLVFPVVFFLMFKGCESLFSTCNASSQILMVVGLALGISVGAGLICGPILFVVLARRRSIKAEKSDGLHLFVVEHATALQVEDVVELRYVQDVEPKAFSLSWPHPIVFLSIGLLDVLSEKEVEAVLLHELYHITSRSSVFKSALWFFRATSPLALFVTFENDLSCEEKEADDFAAMNQGTRSHIMSSKDKINMFFLERNGNKKS